MSMFSRWRAARVARGMAATCPDPRHVLGRVGERAAEDVLVGAGMQVLERRWRTRRGEIDLIAEDGATLVFVEVKTRAREGWGGPCAAVTPDKRRRLAAAALAYLASRDWHARPCRFDVVEVIAAPGAAAILRHHRDAFRP